MLVKAEILRGYTYRYIFRCYTFKDNNILRREVYFYYYFFFFFKKHFYLFKYFNPTVNLKIMTGIFSSQFHKIYASRLVEYGSEHISVLPVDLKISRFWFCHQLLNLNIFV